MKTEPVFWATLQSVAASRPSAALGRNMASGALTKPRDRCLFTLIELLVVIAITTHGFGHKGIGIRTPPVRLLTLPLPLKKKWDIRFPFD